MTLYEVELVEPYTISRWYNSQNNFDFTNKMDYKPVIKNTNNEEQNDSNKVTTSESKGSPPKNTFIKRHRSRNSVSSTSQNFANVMGKMEELREHVSIKKNNNNKK